MPLVKCVPNLEDTIMDVYGPTSPWPFNMTVCLPLSHLLSALESERCKRGLPKSREQPPRERERERECRNSMVNR